MVSPRPQKWFGAAIHEIAFVLLPPNIRAPKYTVGHIADRLPRSQVDLCAILKFAINDNPAVGRAVPRGSRPAPAPPPSTRDGRNDGRYRSGGVYVAPRVYNYYYNPRRYYPYGYGAFGLGYFYYDPYTWYPPSYYSGYGYGGGGYFPNSFFEGELRLSVAPRNAEVYVDGYFAGRVDDFDGVFQALRLEEGAHHIQITAPGYLPLDFDVRIEADRKITYRGALQPYRP